MYLMIDFFFMCMDKLSQFQKIKMKGRYRSNNKNSLVFVQEKDKQTNGIEQRSEKHISACGIQVR